MNGKALEGSSGARLRLYTGLALGVTSVSFAAILIRLAEAPALTIASYRLGLASAVLAPLALILAQGRLRVITVRVWGLALVSALCLALHFAFWIASLDHTSVASSVAIVTANPILVALLAHLFLRESVSLRVATGIGLGLLGGLVIALGDWDIGTENLYGDGLALLGAVAVGGYYILGRKLRGELSLLAYVAPVYAMAAVLLLLAAGVRGAPLWGFSGMTYLYLALVALVPQLLGHSLLNWALGHLRAVLVAASVMAEPVGATLLAWLVLNEPPPLTTVAGAPFILAGVYQVLRE